MRTDGTGHSAPAKGRSIRDWVGMHRRALVVGVVLLFVTNVLDKTVPWILMKAVDALRARQFAQIRDLALGALVLAATIWLVRTYSRIRVFNIGRDVEFDLRNAVLAQVHRLGPAFFRAMSAGEVMSRATNDLGQVRLLVGFGLLNVVNSVFAYVAAIALMLAISPELTVVALIPYPLFILVTRTFSSRLYKRSQEAQSALGALSDGVQETLSGVRVVRTFGLEHREEARFSVLNQASLDANMKLVVLRGLMWPLLTLIGALGALLVIHYGGGMVLRDELTAGELAAFMAYMGQLVWPTLALGYLLAVVQRGRASYARIQEILDATPEILEANDATEASGPGALDVMGLSFERSGKKALDDVRFSLPAGESLAIVGGVGSGKSTLAALLPRLLPVPPGAIALDGEDVTALTLRSLRHAIGYAPQEAFLFSTTVERNIALALPSPDAPGAAERVREATREASVLDEIEGLPEGFDTVVGERGVQLSGGQKQRIALARALVSNPRVLVLDDPLSAVDARTEGLILEAIERAGRGRTVVLVTHRALAARRMDHVVVLDDGRVVEHGDPDVLALGDGPFAALVARQTIEQELEAT